MRFTRIPIIATLLAGALSLLFLMPAFGQTDDDIVQTEGRTKTGDLQVGVFDDVADAQTVRLVRTTNTNRVDGDGNPIPFYLPGADTADADGSLGSLVVGGTFPGVTPSTPDGTIDVTNPAFLTMGYVDTRNTRSGGLLYIGNTDEAYNTALISYKVNNPDGSTVPTRCALYPKAIVSNPRTGGSINVPLVETSGLSTGTPAVRDVQAFFKVVDANAATPLSDVHGPRCSNYDGAQDMMPDPDSPGSQIPVVDANGDPILDDPDLIGQIRARHNDRLNVRIEGQPSNIVLVVDAEAPEINLISPVDTSVVRSSNLSFRFEVRDHDAGLRHDGELALTSDGDPGSIDPDRDGNRASEPLSMAAPTALFGLTNGKAAEIQAVYWSRDPVGDRLTDRAVANVNRSEDITDQGAWTLIGRAGFGYAFSASGATYPDGVNNLQITAMDRVGNLATSDAELDSPDTKEPYLFTVDDGKPTLGAVRTGISYDNAKNREVVNLSSIALTFNEAIKAGEIRLDQITVTDNRVTGVIQPNQGPKTFRGQTDDVDPGDCTLDAMIANPDPAPLIQDPDPNAAPGDMIPNPNHPAQIPNPNLCPGEAIADAGDAGQLPDPRQRVYIQLATPLGSDDTPTVALLSGVAQDLAGNTLDKAVEKDADDWIAPVLTVTVTGAKGDRPVANSAKGSFTVEVRSDEDLNGRPSVLFVPIKANEETEPATGYTYATADSPSPYPNCNLTPQEDDRHWKRDCKVSDLSGVEGLIAMFVVARDDSEGNVRMTPGLENIAHRANINPTIALNAPLDVQKVDDADLLVEVDTAFNGGSASANLDESVTPRSGADTKKTESPNPFIRLQFKEEGSEYAEGAFKDSHGTVEITEIELDGADVTGQMSRVAKNEFSVVLRDKEVGRYKLTYKARDDAGNEYNDGSFTFEVIARKPYKVEVKPGWNLVSLPGDPEDTAIANVLSKTEFLTPVLAYQNGDWLTARRTDDGWQGTLTDITAGYGYWVNARTFETISTLLTEIDPASTPPTVPVTAGWNLLGVIDIDQQAAGEAPGTEVYGEADTYFNSIPWKVAYSYDTQQSVWTRYTPKASVGCSDADEDATTPEVCNNEILNGSGYWVWSQRPSTLVP